MRPEYFKELEDALNNKESVDTIYLDCKKSFDTVPHRWLLAKLKSVGIQGAILSWTEALLKDRKQRCVLYMALCLERHPSG